VLVVSSGWVLSFFITCNLFYVLVAHFVVVVVFFFFFLNNILNTCR
jgi:hypothetical protein